jgi:hypothetical protein
MNGDDTSISTGGGAYVEDNVAKMNADPEHASKWCRKALDQSFRSF